MDTVDMLRYTIDLMNPSIVDIETMSTDNGMNLTSKKSVSYADFVSIVNNSLEADSEIRIGTMPVGFYDGTIDADGLGFHCFIIMEEGIKPINYFDSMYLVPFPALVFEFKVRMGVLKESYVFALSSSRITRNSALYTYPYGNVHDDGMICWGTNVVNKISQLRDAEKIISLFFGCSTNDDLWNACHLLKLPEDGSCNTQRGLLEYLSTKKVFPKEMLKEKTNISLSKRLKSLEKDNAKKKQ